MSEVAKAGRSCTGASFFVPLNDSAVIQNDCEIARATHRERSVRDAGTASERWPAPEDSSAKACQALVRLRRWLLDDAYPVWARDGWDPVHGGFQERLTPAGPVLGESRRACVQVRQIYCFARAGELGWTGDARRLLTAGLDHFLKRYRRSDGLFRTLVAPDGHVVDDRALLEDQACALLAFAEAHRFWGGSSDLLAQARTLLGAIEAQFRQPDDGFVSGLGGRALLSRPHLLLLEAALAWRAISEESCWHRLAEELTRLALDRLIDPQCGVLHEHFAGGSAALPGGAGRLIEPGHQFEWAWLLMRRGSDARARRAAARLLEIGETHGLRNGVAVNALLPDMTVQDSRARLWAQAGRLKALARGALLGEARCWPLAGQAAEVLQRFLDSGARGLWHVRRKPGGEFIREPSPGSSFQAIVCAIGELAAALPA